MKIQQLISYKFGFFIGIPLLMFLVLQLLGFDGLYGQDSYEYLRYSEAIQEYIVNGTHPGTFYWPVLYPFFGSLLGFVFGSSAIGLHFLTCISIGITCFYLFKTLAILYPNRINTSFYYVFTFGLFSPYFLRAGLVVMSDVMSAMFIVLVIYHFFKSYLKNTSFTYVFLFATCALMARYATLVITFPVILLALYFVVKRKEWKAVFIGGILSVLVCIPFIVLQWENLASGTSNYFLNAWSVSHYFKTSYETVDGIQLYLFPNLVFVFYVFVHPGFFFIGLITAFFTLKDFKTIFSFSQKVITVSIVLYLLFLAGIPFQNIRVLTLIFPLVLLFFFPAFYVITEFDAIKKYKKVLAIICVVMQVALWSYSFKTVFKRTLFERELATYLAPFQGNRLFSFDYDVAIEARGLDFEFRNMYTKFHTDFKENDLVFFNPTKLARQWKGKNPMKNWNEIEQSHELKVIESFENGWSLYQIKSKK